MRRNMWVVFAACVIAAVTIFIGCSDEEESSISITSLTANPTTVVAGDTSTITATVDYNGDETVSYEWSCDDGTISGSGNSISWIAPSDTGSYTISLTVSDGDVSDNGNVTIEVFGEDVIGKILYESDKAGNWDIWVMDNDGSNKQQLTTASSDEYGSSWSPDATQISFCSDSVSSRSDIWKMNSDGSEWMQLTDSGSGDSDRQSIWSPDGNNIVFNAYRPYGSGGSIWIMNTDGTDETQILYTSGYDAYAGSFSPDGNRIAYFRCIRYGGEDRGMWLMNTDGSNQTRITTSDIYSHQHPCFSPDGSKIVFASDSLGNYDIWVMDTSGSDQIQLTTNPADDWQPSWSPDGDHIVFASDRNANWDIYIMNSDGSGEIQLTSDTTDEKNPRWSWAEVDMK